MVCDMWTVELLSTKLVHTVLENRVEQGYQMAYSKSVYSSICYNLIRSFFKVLTSEALIDKIFKNTVVFFLAR